MSCFRAVCWSFWLFFVTLFYLKYCDIKNGTITSSDKATSCGTSRFHAGFSLPPPRTISPGIPFLLPPLLCLAPGLLLQKHQAKRYLSQHQGLMTILPIKIRSLLLERSLLDLFQDIVYFPYVTRIIATFFSIATMKPHPETVPDILKGLPKEVG